MADEIIRLDYSAEDIGDNIDEVRTARGTFDTLDDRLDNIEGGGPSPSNPIASNCVSPMTGYSKSSSSTPGNISADDTLNAAIGKLEKRTELNENNILYNTNTGVKNVYDYANSALAYKASSCIATKSTNGISVSSSGTWAFASYPMTLKSGTYKLVCTVSDLVIEGGQVRITIGNNAQASGEALTTFGVSSNGEKISNEFTIQSDSTVYLTLYINQSAQNKSNSMVVSNIMVMPSNIDDTSYHPYAISNSELTAALSPSAFQAVISTPANYVQIDGGGYVRIGNLVIVQIRATWLQSCSEGSAIIQGLPKPLLNYGVYTAGASIVNNYHKNISVMGNGTISWVDGASPSSGGLVLSAVYICKD